MKKFSENIRSTALQGWNVTLVLDNLRSAHNVGNIFRIAEALQLKIIGCGCTPLPPHPVLAKTAMDCDLTVPFTSAVSAVEAIKTLRSCGVGQVLALEHTAESVEVSNFEDVKMPLALVLGNEAKGISSEVLPLCDAAVDLPMLGAKASINVGNSAAAILYAVAALYILYAQAKKRLQ